MQLKKNKHVNGKAHTVIGYTVHIILCVTVSLCLFAMIGFTGGLYQELLTVKQCLARAVPAMLLLAGSAFLHYELFK